MTMTAASLQAGEEPWRTITKRVGAIVSIAPAGRSHSTFILETAGGRVVAKRMNFDRDPKRYMDSLTQAARALSGLCPRPLGAAICGQTCWYALLEWVNGEAPPFVPVQADSIWQAAPGLLAKMRSCAAVPEWRLESIWLDRLERHVGDHRSAASILALLRSSVPGGPRSLAHGDFSLQNVIRTFHGVVLVDWEEFGSAPAGFDAGWMLALARMGYGPPRSHREMFEVFGAAGFPESNLTWFETLGLLRLLFRARTLPLESGTRQLVLSAVEGALHDAQSALTEVTCR
jgi:aminoglycoside phosphotransferase (APT) family kinase protein